MAQVRGDAFQEPEILRFALQDKTAEPGVCGLVGKDPQDVAVPPIIGARLQHPFVEQPEAAVESALRSVVGKDDAVGPAVGVGEAEEALQVVQDPGQVVGDR